MQTTATHASDGNYLRKLSLLTHSNCNRKNYGYCNAGILLLRSKRIPDYEYSYRIINIALRENLRTKSDKAARTFYTRLKRSGSYHEIHCRESV